MCYSAVTSLWFDISLYYTSLWMSLVRRPQTRGSRSYITRLSCSGRPAPALPRGLVSRKRCEDNIYKDLTWTGYKGAVWLYWLNSCWIPCRSQELLPFLPVIYFFPATLLHQLFFHPSSHHLFISWSTIGLVVSKFTYNTILGIPFSSILCTCPNQRNLSNLTVSVMVGFF
jgi:hypothetical protein